MTPETYQRYTEELTARLNIREHVLGLVAVGSMAAQDYLPDQWSDHDFFVIVESGHQEEFRTNLSWLPASNEIIFSFRETAHGVKALYRDVHLIEFAVFDLDELYLAQVNRYRILLDRCNLDTHMRKVRERTRQETATTDAKWLFGQFLTNLLVGVGRHRRGERLSAHFFVKYSALRNLALLCHAFLSSSAKHLLDDVDPFRRLEYVFPETADRFNSILLLDTPAAAVQMLEFAKEAFRQQLPDYPLDAIEAVLNFLNEDPLDPRSLTQ